MTKKQRKNLIRILVSAALLVILHFAPVHGVIRFVAYLVPYFIIGYDVLLKAFKGIKNRQPFDESLLMAIATIGAIVLALYEDGDYVEAIAVMLFYQIGEWFQSYAVGRSRRNISELMDICPDVAFVEGDDGEKVEVDPDDVEIGSILLVSPGEKIPIDGIVVEGSSSLDTAALTGESLPRDVKVGDEVVSGCININGLLKIKTTKEFGESTASKVLEMIEDASSRKSKSEAFITKFARVYTPIVVYSAIALALIPPTVIMALGGGVTYATWIYRALTFLIISCPCALVVSIPLSFFAALVIQ
jgi:Cd2+/Zn2+-exporting ATPase